MAELNLVNCYAELSPLLVHMLAVAGSDLGGERKGGSGGGMGRSRRDSRQKERRSTAVYRTFMCAAAPGLTFTFAFLRPSSPNTSTSTHRKDPYP